MIICLMKFTTQSSPHINLVIICTIEKFNHELSVGSNTLSICNFNIRSYQSNSETFFNFMCNLNAKFDILVLTETRFCGSDGCRVDGYNRCHSGRSRGGVSEYCSDFLSMKKVEHVSSINNDDVEACVVEITSSSRKAIVLAVYRLSIFLNGFARCFLCSIESNFLIIS